MDDQLYVSRYVCEMKNIFVSILQTKKIPTYACLSRPAPEDTLTPKFPDLSEDAYNDVTWSCTDTIHSQFRLLNLNFHIVKLRHLILFHSGVLVCMSVCLEWVGKGVHKLHNHTTMIIEVVSI